MKFEDYIKNNKKSISHTPADKDDMWTDIASQIPDTKVKSGFYWRIAAVSALIIIGLGYWIMLMNGKSETVDANQQEIFALKQKINGLMSQQKTSARILAVSMTEDINPNDQDIINILIERMTNDESPNVRIAAIRALESHTDSEIVRVAMVEELARSKNQYIQVNLMNILSDINDKRIEPYLDSIIDKGSDKSILYNEAFDNKAILKEI